MRHFREYWPMYALGCAVFVVIAVISYTAWSERDLQLRCMERGGDWQADGCYLYKRYPK